jgi:hypothetical protein
LHFFRAIFAKRAFIRANKGFTIDWEVAPTLLAFCSHLQGHVVSNAAQFIV